ncbi:hypothetical protein D3C71_1692740 [compost metagenome]
MWGEEMFFLAIALGLFMIVVGGIVAYGGMFAVGVTLAVAGVIEIIAILYFYHQQGTLRKEVNKCDPGCGSGDCGPWDYIMAWQCLDTAGDCALIAAITDCEMPDCPSLPDCDCDTPDCDCEL